MPGNMRIVVRLLKQQGIVFHDSVTETALLRKLLDPVFETMADVLEQNRVAVVFLYRWADQPKNSVLQGCDGQCFAHLDTVTKTNLSSIGLEISTLHRDDATTFVPFLFLHEVAHANCGPDHSDGYENYLNYILQVFEERTGIHLVNDLAGYEGDVPSTIID